MKCDRSVDMAIGFGSHFGSPMSQDVNYSYSFCLSEWEMKCTFEPPHDKTNKMACVPNEDSDQPGHPPSLIRVFADRMKKAWVLSCALSAHRRLWSDWADAQADLSLRWAHIHFVGFVMRRLISHFLEVFCHEYSTHSIQTALIFLLLLIVL